jgi:8-oxo-dGTP diphosphatase
MSLEDICLKLRFKLKPPEHFKLKPCFGKAAVAIILYVSGGGFEALYVKRTCNPSDPWSGQVAFPGGRFRGDDGDIIKTAIREVYEETSIKLSRIDILGLMEGFHPLNEPRLEVIPVVALTKSKPNVRLSSELQEYFWAPVNRLNKGSVEVKHSNGRVECVEAYMYDGYIIWGLTARITESLIKILQGL